MFWLFGPVFSVSNRTRDVNIHTIFNDAAPVIINIYTSRSQNEMRS